MECPFSADRLQELRWVENWRPDQIATLAQAATGEAVDEATVRAWFAATGIKADPDPKSQPPVATPRKPRAGRRKTGGKVAAPPVTLICSYCEQTFERPAHRWNEDAKDHYCCLDHKQQHQIARAKSHRAEIRRFASQPEKMVKLGYSAALKRCRVCKEEKPLEAFSLDLQRRGDGRASLCLECNRGKSQEYAKQHAERLRLKALARKRKLKIERLEAAGQLTDELRLALDAEIADLQARAEALKNAATKSE